MKHYKNVILLTLTAVIWGFAFSFQKSGMEHLGPYAFNSIRNLVGALFLLPCIALLDRFTPPSERAALNKVPTSLLLRGGLCCGIALAVASTMQQIGIQYTTAGKGGFITACYIIIVPLLGVLFFHRKCSPLLWVATILAVCALYLLCLTDAFVLEKGDFYVLVCAFLFALHILVIDAFAPRVDGVRLSCIQFFVASVLCAIPMLIMEGLPTLQALRGAGTAILYTGILSSGIAYTCQILGQRNFNPTAASIIMSLESTFAVIGGWIFLGEQLTLRQFLGCGLMFVAIILAQCPSPKKRHSITRKPSLPKD